jgi:hypothetical protein
MGAENVHPSGPTSGACDDSCARAAGNIVNM